MIVEGDLAAGLKNGLEAIGVSVAPEKEHKLLDFIALIAKWNRVYNLTAVREPSNMLTHHVLDSLAVAPHIEGHTLLDVGSGAGLPGIPLAIARADLRVTLLDSNAKKTTFQQQAVIELALHNVEAVNARVEALDPSLQFDIVISRAYSDLEQFVCAAGPFCAPGGTLAAMKGLYPEDELARVPATFEVEKVVPLKVPGVEGERHLVLMRRARRDSVGPSEARA
jgi:16S rRNA (guanine527-N7)-methyltransferase